MSRSQQAFAYGMQVLSIVTVAVAFVAMVGSIFGMNLYFNVQTTPPVCIIACAYVCLSCCVNAHSYLPLVLVSFLLWHGPGTSRGLLECSLLYCESVLTLTAEQSTLRACYCFAGGILGMRNIYCRGWVGYHADYHGIR